MGSLLSSWLERSSFARRFGLLSVTELCTPLERGECSQRGRSQWTISAAGRAGAIQVAAGQDLDGQAAASADFCREKRK